MHGQGYRNDFRRGNFRGNPGMFQNFRGQNNRVDIKETIEMIIMKEVGVGLEKAHRQFQKK